MCNYASATGSATKSQINATDATDAGSEEQYQTSLFAGNAENLYLSYMPCVLLVYTEAADV